MVRAPQVLGYKCGFTTRHYFDCLFRAKDLGYKIRRVCDWNKDDEKFIILRHDIDFSLDYAHRIATYESRFGFYSSYYVYLHSNTYNALSPKNMAIIKKIAGLGHEIGLHYDERYNLDSEDSILQNIVTPKPVMTKTMHNTAWSSTKPVFGQEKYISESGRNWREGCMCQHIGKEDKLYILTHPVWWIKDGSRDKIVHEIISDCKGNMDNVHTDIRKDLQTYCKGLGIEY